MTKRGIKKRSGKWKTLRTGSKKARSRTKMSKGRNEKKRRGGGIGDSEEVRIIKEEAEKLREGRNRRSI